jgi:hypothetical protein
MKQQHIFSTTQFSYHPSHNVLNYKEGAYILVFIINGENRFIFAWIGFV